MTSPKYLVAAAALAIVGGGAAGAYRAGWFAQGLPGIAASRSGQTVAAPRGEQPHTAGAVRDAGSSAPLASRGTEAAAQTAAGSPSGTRSASDPLNLLSIDMGARIESATSQYDEAEAAFHVLDASAGFWSSLDHPTLPQDLVFSFAGRQPVLIGAILINPGTPESPGRWAKDVEIWSSMVSPADGFTRIASATLAGQRVDQAIQVEPFESRYLKVHVLASQASPPEYVQISKIKAIEGRRPGYVSIVDRSPDLAASLKGAPAGPRGDGIAAGRGGEGSLTGDVCGPVQSGVRPVTNPGTNSPANHDESHRVLVLTRNKEDYGPLRYKATDTFASEVDRPIYSRLMLTTSRPEEAWPTQLSSGDGFDTVVLSQLCDIKTGLPEPFKQALMPWVAAGHKLIIQDADGCGRGRVPDYRFLPYRFATSNPGATGARGDRLLFVEENTLANADPKQPGFLDIEAWLKATNNNRNELGDSNTIKQYDSHWCGHLFGTNVLKVNGFMEAYTHYGRGLVIYDGFDRDQNDTPIYRRLATRELAQPFDPDGLPCSARLGDFVITTDQALKSQWMTPGRTYSYPLTLLSNQGYKGAIKLSLAVAPPDPTLSGAFASDQVDLTEIGTSALTVTTTLASPRTAHTLAVRGTDAAGVSNTLCLTLDVRKTGALQVLTSFPRPKKPTRNLEIILDLSGSMKLPLGKSTRIGTARQVLRTVLAQVPDDFNVGLRLYGHRYGSRQKETCTDTELVLPIQKLDRARLLSIVDRTQPRGETPLVYSVLQTPADLKPLGGGSVVLITDGEESCNGDPVAAARQLKDAGIDVTLNIVGFTLTGKQVEQQLGTLAEATGGRYYSAQSGDALSRALMMAAIETFPFTVFDATGKQVATGEAGRAATELPAGDYRVVVRAANEEVVAEHVSVAPGADAVVKVVLKGDRLAIER
jgi:hypothetical protein